MPVQNETNQSAIITGTIITNQLVLLIQSITLLCEKEEVATGAICQ